MTLQFATNLQLLQLTIVIEKVKISFFLSLFHKYDQFRTAKCLSGVLTQDIQIPEYQERRASASSTGRLTVGKARLRR